MKKIILVLSLVTTFQSASALQITYLENGKDHLQVVSGPIPGATPPPEETREDGSFDQIGLAIMAQLRSGKISNSEGFRAPTNGTAMAGLKIWGYVPEGKSPLIYYNVSGGINFGSEKGAGQSILELGSAGDVSVGYTFLKNDDGADVMMGGVGHLAAGVLLHSDEKGSLNGFFGPETGLRFKRGRVHGTLTAAVGFGGSSCTLENDEGESLQVGSGFWGTAGIARLVIGGRFAANVMYMNFAKASDSRGGRLNSDGSEKNRKAWTNSANVLNGTLFWTVGENVTLTGNCTITKNKQVDTELTPEGEAVKTVATDLKRSSFQVGIVRKF